MDGGKHMTVSTSINKVSYKGNGIVKEFAVPFYFLDASDIEIWLVQKRCPNESWSLKASTVFREQEI